MPWRLIGIIVIFAFLLGFIGLNLDNTCDLSLGFKVFTGIPVYITVFVSFMLGLLFSLPFFVFRSIKKRPKREKFPGFTSAKRGSANRLPEENQLPEENAGETPGKETYGID